MGVCHFCGIIILEIKIEGTCSCRTGILNHDRIQEWFLQHHLWLTHLRSSLALEANVVLSDTIEGTRSYICLLYHPLLLFIIAPKMLHSLISNPRSCERPLAMDDEKTNFSLSHCSIFTIVKWLKDVKGSWPQHISSNSITFLRENISKAGKTTSAITNSIELTIYLSQHCLGHGDV